MICSAAAGASGQGIVGASGEEIAAVRFVG